MALVCTYTVRDARFNKADVWMCGVWCVRHAGGRGGKEEIVNWSVARYLF